MHVCFKTTYVLHPAWTTKIPGIHIKFYIWFTFQDKFFLICTFNTYWQVKIIFLQKCKETDIQPRRQTVRAVTIVLNPKGWREKTLQWCGIDIVSSAQKLVPQRLLVMKPYRFLVMLLTMPTLSLRSRSVISNRRSPSTWQSRNSSANSSNPTFKKQHRCFSLLPQLILYLQ